MTELQNRLEHLVNYSSQLIFVSGDTIAQQQKSLEDFLSVQKENTEISYIEAQESMDASDYRRLICRQLMGQTVGSYVRPLKELLKSLSQQSGPFLVCIKFSEHLPNDFLQELWEWVIHSRKHAKDQHLNIILFGETKWAEHAKQWLPNKNSDKPVLLSNHSISSTGFDPKALENLMSQSNASFRGQFFGRGEANSANLLGNKWFISAVLVIFFASFIGMISWQYPGYVSEFLKTGKLPDVAEAKDTQDITTTSIDEAEQTSNLEILPQTQLEVVEEMPFEANEILVSDWQNRNTERKVEDSPESVEDSATNGDFAVPDIINVEQLDAALGVGLEQETAEELTPAYLFDENIILTLEDDAVLLQLSGIQNPSVLATYIESNKLKENTWIYETNRYGGAWYVVLYAQAFNSLDEARRAVQDLPANVRNAEPFAKVAGQIKQEIQNKS
ncbi:SPOR domain-containing protein [Glaciecola sp. KUL10]|uniref:SPOR domain-containing protein n=1 Tax=Glaciecola sp. (strain KUL10) TaxID=2161813 RepID=UPI000D78651F|nr:DamX-like protein [Glaciecola sp. KUL10]GBL03755.1 DamX-related protein [Glaciecola sp. KUL10]